MNTSRRTAVIVGVLFLTAMVTSIVGGGLIEPVLTSPNGLQDITQNQGQLIAGVFLELINAIAVVGIAVLMFPLFQKVQAGLALGYIGLRLIEAIMQVASDVIPLSMLTVSQEYVATGMMDASAFQAVGAVLIAIRTTLVGTMLAIFFGLGALLFYSLLLRSKLIPRWISVWGLIGALLILTWNVSAALGFQWSAGMILALPMILNEIFLGIWLIAKGFSPKADQPAEAAQVQMTYS